MPTSPLISPGPLQRILAAIPEGGTGRRREAGRNIPLQESPLLLRRSDTVGELEGTIRVEVIVGDHAKWPSAEVAEQTAQLPATDNVGRLARGNPMFALAKRQLVNRSGLEVTRDVGGDRPVVVSSVQPRHGSPPLA